MECNLVVPSRPPVKGLRGADSFCRGDQLTVPSRYVITLRRLLGAVGRRKLRFLLLFHGCPTRMFGLPINLRQDRKSTRLNSSHGYISYAVFCLKKKKHGIPLPLLRAKQRPT